MCTILLWFDLDFARLKFLFDYVFALVLTGKCRGSTMRASSPPDTFTDIDRSE